MKKILSLLAAFALVLTLSSCSTDEKDPVDPVDPVETDKTFYIVGAADGKTDRIQNPWHQNGQVSVTQSMRCLLLPDADLYGLNPDLAKSYTVSEDGLTITYVMDESKWSDGTAVSAEDIKFSIELAALTPIKNGIYVAPINKIVGAEEYIAGNADEISGIAIDGDTVTITLTTADPTFNRIIGGQLNIMPAHKLQDADPLEFYNDDYWKMPLSNGPFVVTEVVPGSYVLLEHNDMWDGATPDIEKIQLNFLSDQVIAAQDGKASYLSTNSPDQINELDKIETLEKNPVDIIFYRYFIVNQTPEGIDGETPFADPKVREAVMYAIDREALVEAFYGQTGSVISGTRLESDPNFNDELTDFAYDAEKAKDLLEEAGWDEDFVVRIRYYYSDQSSINFVETLATYLNAVGMKTDVQKFVADATSELTQLKNYDIALKGLGAFSYSEWLGEYVNANYGDILNVSDELAQKIEEYSLEVDPDKANEILDEIEKLEQEGLYKLPMHIIQQMVYVDTDRFDVPSGVEFGHPWYNHDIKFTEWTVK